MMSINISETAMSFCHCLGEIITNWLHNLLFDQCLKYSLKDLNHSNSFYRVVTNTISLTLMWVFFANDTSIHHSPFLHWMSIVFYKSCAKRQFHCHWPIHYHFSFQDILETVLWYTQPEVLFGSLWWKNLSGFYLSPGHSELCLRTPYDAHVWPSFFTDLKSFISRP